MCSPDAPDTSGQNAAALRMSELSAEQLAWMKQIYSDTAPDRAAATERANAVSDAQMQSMATQTGLAQDYADYQAKTFRPLEQGIVAEAEAYDTPERRAAASGQAMADVGTQAAAARGAIARDAASRGVDPSSGNFAATQGAFGVRTAGAQAAAGNAASTQVETIGAAKKADAANLGRNLASNQATTAGIALTAGNSAAVNQAGALTAATSGAGILNSGYAGAQSGLSNAASTYGAIANTEAQAANNSGLWGALGQVGGAAITKWSDRTMKEDIEPVDQDAALAAVEATPVSNWAYKNGTKGADGGQPHTGPMAQDVQKNMGDKAAPKGKKVDLVSLNGIAMAAIQGLSKKVDRIAAMNGLPA